MTQRRLDELVAHLASTRPTLDDLTRARVASRIDAARAVAPVVARRRWPWVVAAGGAAAAVAAIALLLRGGGAPAPGAPATELTAGVAAPARGELAGAAITLYGPGRAREEDGRIIIDQAETVIVDRAVADAPIEVVVGKTTIRALAAAFAVDARVMRVTAIRGDLLVRCDGDDLARAVAAGGSMTCDARIASAPKPPPPADTAALPAQPSARASAGALGPPSTRARTEPHATTVAVTEPPTQTRTEPRSTTAAVTEPSTRARTDAAGTEPSRTEPRSTTAAATEPSTRARTDGAGTEPSRAEPRSTTAAVTEPSTRAPAEPHATAGRAPSTRAPTEPATRAAATSTPAVPEAAAKAPSPEERYASAERLIVANPRAARVALRDLVMAAPQAAVTAPALVDLARLAIAAGDAAEARTALDRLARHPHRAPLAMPADYLRCMIDGTPRCLARFREMYPDSPHDADVLARLAVATGATDCGAARPLIAEYLRRYPQGAGRAALTAWRDRCR